MRTVCSPGGYKPSARVEVFGGAMDKPQIHMFGTF